ncbi:MAG: DUF2341 domain-containing protein [Candidatus Heimdallarchaeota archaeon]
MRGMKGYRNLIQFMCISLLVLSTLSISTLAKETDIIEPEKISSNWFDTAFAYRWKFNITWNRLIELTDHQVLITLPFDFDYDLVKENGEDIRITTGNRVELPFWIEKWSRTDTSRIWVTVPLIRDSRVHENYIYLYAGNPDASSVSSGEDTFLFFEDFENQTLGSEPEGWYVNESIYGQIEISDNSLTGENSLHYFDSSLTGSPIAFLDFGMDITGYILEFFFNYDYIFRSGGLAYTQDNDSLSGGNSLIGHLDSNQLVSYHGSDYTYITNFLQVGLWFTLEIHISGSTIYDQNLYYQWDTLLVQAWDIELYGSVSSVNYLQFWQYDSDICSFYIDGLRVRKQTFYRFHPTSIINELEEFIVGKSTIIGFSMKYQLFSVAIIFVIIRSFPRKKRKCN